MKAPVQSSEKTGEATYQQKWKWRFIKMYHSRARLSSGLGDEFLMRLEDCIEKEVKYLYCGDSQRLNQLVSEHGQAHHILQYYLSDNLFMLSKFFLEQVHFSEPFPEEFIVSRLRVRRITHRGTTTFLLQLKGIAPASHVTQGDLNYESVKLELGTVIDRQLFDNLVESYAIGSVSKTRHLVPIRELGLTAEIDFIETCGPKKQPARIITADVEYSSQEQFEMLMRPEKVDTLHGFVPVAEDCVLRSAFKNAALATDGISKASMNMLRAAGACIW